MTDHSVYAVGVPLLRRGREILKLEGNESVEARIRVPGDDDVMVTAGAETTAITLVPPDGTATIETDAATRVLLLWGRRPADPGRIRSAAGPLELGRLRTLLSGY
jgi:hypothetical protein